MLLEVPSLPVLAGGSVEPVEYEFTAVSASDGHACGLRGDRTVVCWGWNRRGQTDAPPGEFTSVSTGDRHACGLRRDATITCWGVNDRGQASAPAGEFVAISAGYWHSCGIRTNATIACWGFNRNRRSDAPAGYFTAIATGSDHSCGRRRDAAIECWGNNENGRSDAPGGEFVAVAARGAFRAGYALMPPSPAGAPSPLTSKATTTHDPPSAPIQSRCGEVVGSGLAWWGHPEMRSIRSSNSAGTCSGYGGTYRDQIGVYSLPPIQFCLSRICPPLSGRGECRISFRWASRRSSRVKRSPRRAACSISG